MFVPIATLHRDETATFMMSDRQQELITFDEKLRQAALNTGHEPMPPVSGKPVSMR
jgi:hypothetical protein